MVCRVEVARLEAVKALLAWLKTEAPLLFDRDEGRAAIVGWMQVSTWLYICIHIVVLSLYIIIYIYSDVIHTLVDIQRCMCRACAARSTLSYSHMEASMVHSTLPLLLQGRL